MVKIDKMELIELMTGNLSESMRLYRMKPKDFEAKYGRTDILQPSMTAIRRQIVLLRAELMDLSKGLFEERGMDDGN